MGALETLNKKLGSDLKEVILDGKYHHVSDGKKDKKPLWYIGSEVIYNGESYFRITCGDLRSGSKFFLTNHDKKTITKAQKAQIKEDQDLQKKQAEIENERIYESCREKWYPIWESLPQAEKHSYLTHKKVNAAPMVKIDDRGTLLIPLFDHEKFNGIQKIYNMDHENPKFFKFFVEGSCPSYSFFPFGDIKNAKHVYVSEGYATAASVHEATERPAICCFNAGNIRNAIESLRIINPECRITIAADNDFDLAGNRPEIGNVGIKKATDAAKAIGNCTIKYPENHNDFNDLFCDLGKQAVIDALEEKESEFPDVICLGYKDDRSYYFTTHTKQLSSLSPYQHERHHFVKMMPTRYWGNKYRFALDKEGEKTTEADWKYIEECLQEEQGKKGFFNPQLVRGYGAWKDQDRIIFNTGDSLIIDGVQRPIFDQKLETKYFYEAGTDLDISLDDNDQLSDEKGQRIVSAFKMLRYKNPQDHIYLASWIAQAQIFGALDWRFHLWITGERGNGKSTILQYMSAMIPDSKLFEGTTAAGIRQTLKNDAFATLYDEAEADEKRMKDVISMARQCSSNNGSITARGTTAGQALQYNTNTVFCMGSIQPAIRDSADISRFFSIEMLSLIGQTSSEFALLDAEMQKIAKYSRKLRNRLIAIIPVVRQSITACRDQLRKTLPPRQADQVSVSIALHWHLVSRDAITCQQINDYIDYMDLQKSDYVNDNDSTDSDACYDAIMQLFVTKSEDSTIQMHINKIKASAQWMIHEDELAMLGIKYLRDKDQLFISYSNNLLQSKLSRVSKFVNYAKLLRRHVKFGCVTTARIFGVVTKGISINL